MSLTRRDFFRYCSLSAAALGLDVYKLGLLREALANPAAPSVLWLHGSACQGCSISFLNRISDRPAEPATVADVLLTHINLAYHSVVMGSAGDTSVAALKRVHNQGGYILVLEGSLPTAFGGRCCMPYAYNGAEVTFQQAVQELSAKAAAIVCVGTCASFGGIPAAGSNPTKAMGIGAYTGRKTINISGCPSNPDWVVWAVVQLLQNQTVALDVDGRPTALYSFDHNGTGVNPIIHEKCPRNPIVHPTIPRAVQFGEEGHCLEDLGCRGPFTKSRCEASWNGIGGHVYPELHPGHWCIGVNAPCHGCVEKTFPGPESFYEPYSG